MKTLMHKEQHSGAVSLIIAVIIAIILGVVTVGFVRLMVDEGRQASDDDLTTRAFYAAESGVEDAKRKLEPYVNGDEDLSNIDNVTSTDCGTAFSLATDSGYETEVTCQKIEVELGDFISDTNMGQTVQIPLDAATGDFTQVRVRWHNKSEDNNYSINPTTWERLSGWGDAPAALKVALISYPQTSFTRDEILHKEVYVAPSSNGTSTINMQSSNFYNDPANLTGHKAPGSQQGACIGPGDASSTYACETNLTNLNSSARNYVLRITSLYANTEVNVELYDSSNNVVTMRNAQAKIDTTGRAGDVLRRVQARLSLNATVEEGNQASLVSRLLPSFAITSNNVCKNTQLTDDTSDFNDPSINPGINPTGDYYCAN